MELLTRNECPLCRSRELAPFAKESFAPGSLQSDDFRITDNRYGRRWRFDACRRCGYVFANPHLQEVDLLAFYSRLQDDEYGKERENRAKNFASVLRRLRRLQPPGQSLLDVGAASGIFLDLARAQGYSVSGIEPSAPLAAEARSRYGLELHPGTLESFNSKSRFAAMTLLDIIEHVYDPDRLLARAGELLLPGGVLVVVTPDIGSLAARLCGRRWWHYRSAHIQFFNRRSLRFLLEKHGFTIAATRRYAWNFSMLYLASRLVPSLKKTGTLQKILKKLNLRLQLFDSLEVYARKKKD